METPADALPGLAFNDVISSLKSFAGSAHRALDLPLDAGWHRVLRPGKICHVGKTSKIL
jgi:hypothetical protein